MVDVRLRIFIPARAALVAVPGVADFGYGGDTRGFSFNDGTARADLWVDVDNSISVQQPIVVKRCEFGVSTAYPVEAVPHVGGKPLWWREVRRVPLLDIEEAPSNMEQLQPTFDKIHVTGQSVPGTFGIGALVKLTFHVDAKLPLQPLAPAIDCDLEVEIGATGLPSFPYTIKGSHDGFPCYELYFNQRQVYSFDPVPVGNGPTNLALRNVFVNETGLFV